MGVKILGHTVDGEAQRVVQVGTQLLAGFFLRTEELRYGESLLRGES